MAAHAVARETLVCSKCGRRVPACAMQNHQRICVRMPSDAELRRLVKSGMRLMEMAAQIGIDHSTLRHYLMRLGLWQKTGTRNRVPSRAALVNNLVRRNAEGGCAECDAAARCQERMSVRLGLGSSSVLWPLCCAPMRHEVERAVTLGIYPQEVLT